MNLELWDFTNYVAVLEESVKVPKGVQKSFYRYRYRSFHCDPYMVEYVIAENIQHAIEKINSKFSFWGGEEWIVYAKILKIQKWDSSASEKMWNLANNLRSNRK